MVTTQASKTFEIQRFVPHRPWGERGIAGRLCHNSKTKSKSFNTKFTKNTKVAKLKTRVNKINVFNFPVKLIFYSVALFWCFYLYKCYCDTVWGRSPSPRQGLRPRHSSKTLSLLYFIMHKLQTLLFAHSQLEHAKRYI